MLYTLHASGAGPEATDLPSAAESSGAPSALPSGASTDTYRERFWLVDPRVRPAVPESDLLRLEIHGEYQLRYTALSDVGLSTYGLADYRPSLGQRHRLEHRMRFTPRLAYRDDVSVVAQFDVPRGTLLGERTDHVTADPEPMAETQPMAFALRWLYADVRFDVGHLTIGQQPARWGMGLLYDSGDERQFFGDARLGTIVERVAFLGKPLGHGVPVELLLATDWVYSDGRISWLDGDRALRAMTGLRWTPGSGRHLGLLVAGEKLQPRYAAAELNARRPSETTVTFDVEGSTTIAVPGQAAFVIAQGEAALGVGTTDIAPEVLRSARSRVQRFGAIARLGAIATRGTGTRRWGKWGMMLEWGYASGDADPGDGVDRGFTPNPSRRVGLVLFDEVMRWKSARAQTALDDPRLGERPTAAASRVATAGGSSGATYLSLAWLYRPVPNWDVRAAALLAQTTADLVDPTRLAIRGVWANFDGGRVSHRDLGTEFDLGTEWRQPLDNGLGLSIGAEGGVLLPGRALADASGSTNGPSGLVRGRFGFYF